MYIHVKYDYMKLIQTVFNLDADAQAVASNLASTFILNNVSISWTRDPDSTIQVSVLSLYQSQVDSADDLAALSAATPTVVTFQDYKPILQLTPNRVDDAQAGYKVVGYAPVSVIQKEFDNYEYFIPSGGSPGYALYRGILKVSKTDVFTPQFLTYTNTQFQF